jgi:hypothetical protein
VFVCVCLFFFFHGGESELKTQLQDPSFHSFQSWFAVVTPRVRMKRQKKKLWTEGAEKNKQMNHKLFVNRAKRDCVGSDHSRECSGAV